MTTPSLSLITACETVGKSITSITHKGLSVPGWKLLTTISGLESDFGRLREYVRSEPGYTAGGTYYQNPVVREQWRRWGVLASASYGSFQIMFITALEMGYKDHPIRLQDDYIGCFWAGELIRKRLIGRHGAKTLEDVLDGYNSGNHRDRYIPTSYIEKGVRIFEGL